MRIEDGSVESIFFFFSFSSIFFLSVALVYSSLSFSGTLIAMMKYRECNKNVRRMLTRTSRHTFIMRHYLGGSEAVRVMKTNTKAFF